MKKINTDETDEFEKYKLNLSRCSNPDVKALKQWSFVLTRANEIRGPRELRGSRVVVIVGTHPQAIPLAMITMAKLIHWFSFLSYMSMGLCLAALWAARAPL